MGISTITSQYTGLNGITSYGTSYSGGLYSDAYVDTVKDSIENSYEISATSNSYSNKSTVSSSSFAQQCQAIEYLLEQGRTDAAMDKYDDLYEDMASNSYYSGYTENEIKTLLQEKYLDATGSTIVSSISESADSAYTTGVKSSIPIIGALYSTNSADDFIAEATGTETSGWSKVKSALGVVTGTTLSAAAGAGIATAVSVAKGVASKTEGTGILKAATDAIKNSSGKTKAIAAVAAGVLALGTYVVGKIIDSDD
ncbi:MAG: hypothetical protein LUE64_00015 [Candidatus Gastranaerophilales bacterium]|nr:hypothetical protein [Candidatus Gastranaerophilales bacterium]